MPRRGAVGDLRFKKRDSTRLFLLQPQPLLSSFARAPKKTSRALARLVCAVQVTVVENQRNRRQPNQQARKRERERELPSLTLSLPFSSAPRSETLYLPVQLSPLSPPLLVCTNFYPPTNYNRICRWTTQAEKAAKERLTRKIRICDVFRSKKIDPGARNCSCGEKEISLSEKSCSSAAVLWLVRSDHHSCHLWHRTQSRVLFCFCSDFVFNHSNANEKKLSNLVGVVIMSRRRGQSLDVAETELTSSLLSLLLVSSSSSSSPTSLSWRVFIAVSTYPQWAWSKKQWWLDSCPSVQARHTPTYSVTQSQF